MSNKYDLSGWDLTELLPDTAEETIAARLTELEQEVSAFEAMRGSIERFLCYPEKWCRARTRSNSVHAGNRTHLGTDVCAGSLWKSLVFRRHTVGRGLTIRRLHATRADSVAESGSLF